MGSPRITREVRKLAREMNMKLARAKVPCVSIAVDVKTGKILAVASDHERVARALERRRTPDGSWEIGSYEMEI